MNYDGIIIAVSAFLGIGLFHPIVIKAEYYFFKNCWPVFLLCGLMAIFFSLRITSVVSSAISGSAGCSFLWSIVELFEQEKRVKKGWFPQNPRRMKRKENMKALIAV